MLFLWLAVHSVQAQTQQVRLPSPDAMAAIRFIQNPPNLYSGASSINVPIGGGVSLSYHTGGNKVSEYASSVGLGWSLNAGGMITRIVRGIPDELPNGYFDRKNVDDATYNGGAGRGQQVEEFIAQGGNANLENFNNGTYDTEPDLYYIKAGGLTGVFTFDKQGNAVMMPHQDVQIERVSSFRKNGYPVSGPEVKDAFKVTTSDGSVYYFGNQVDGNGYSISRDVATYNRKLNGSGSEVDFGTSDSYTATWHLTRIITVSSGAIEFSYADFNTNATPKQSYAYYQQIYGNKHFINNPDNVVEENLTTLNHLVTLEKAFRLTKVQSSSGVVELIWRGFREDLPAYPLLSGIVVSRYGGYSGADLDLVTKNSKYDKIFRLKFGYFGSGTSKRLRLDEIQQEDLLPYTFTYNESMVLPSYGSAQIDHWGYYNSNAHKISGTNSAIPSYTLPYYGTQISGANREVDTERQQVTMLTRVNFPNGGYTQYNYESNTFLHNGQEVKGPGLRLKSVTTSDGLNSSKNQTVYYAYNQVANGDTYNPQTATSGLYQGSYPLQYLVSYSNDNTHTQNFLISNPVLFWSNGVEPLVGYQTVTTYQEGNGYVVNDFTSHADTPNTTTQRAAYLSNLAPQAMPFAPNTSLFWRRGLPKQVRVFRQNGTIQKQTNYTYGASSQNNRSITGLRLFKMEGNGTHYAWYYLKSEPYRLLRVEDKTYTDDSSEKFMTTSTVYDYDKYGVNHELPNTITSTLADGKVRFVENVYVKDYDTTAVGVDLNEQQKALKTLYERNMNRVIESTTWARDHAAAPRKLLGGSFKEFDESLRAHKSYAMELAQPLVNPSYNPLLSVNPYVKNNRYQEQVRYMHGNYSSTVLKKSGTPITTVQQTNYSTTGWRSSSLSARAVNATLEEVAYVGFEGSGNENKWRVIPKVSSDVQLNVAYSGQYSFRGYIDLTGYTTHPDNAGANTPSCSTVPFRIVPNLIGGTAPLPHIVKFKSGKYVLSFWAKVVSNAAPILDGNNQEEANGVLVNGCHTVTANQLSDQEWKRFEITINVPEDPYLSLKTLGKVFIDEVRLHPVDARMVTYANDPRLGVISVTNAQGIPSFNEYDTYGRLVIQRDVDGNIIRKTDYHQPHVARNPGNNQPLKKKIVVDSAACLQTYDNLEFRLQDDNTNIVNGYSVVDFGDGSGKKAVTGSTFYHTYTKAGTYKIKLTFYSKDYKPEPVEKEVTVSNRIRVTYMGCGTYDLLKGEYVGSQSCSFDACTVTRDQNQLSYTTLPVRVHASGGSKALQYTWFKGSAANNEWTRLDRTGSSIKLPYATSSYDLMCIVTDGTYDLDSEKAEPGQPMVITDAERAAYRCKHASKVISVLVSKSNPNCGNE